ncbi:MAG: hypothetical protein ACI4C1_02605 [Lachnospiraceae bacterium]
MRRNSRNKKMVTKRAFAGILSLTLVGVSLAGCAAQTNTTVIETVMADSASSEDAQEDNLLSVMELGESQSNLEVGKEETVYLFADNTGDVKSTVVSGWLKNPQAKNIITDVTNLSDVTNVNGDETFEKNGDEYTWKSNGKDIYYQGTTEEEAPIQVTLSYYLDGEKIAPDELAGKSGHVKIRFDYENRETVTSSINGGEEEIYVPFVAVTGMILNSSFRNIEVTNGRLVADGKNNIVVGFALPGLKQSLKLDDTRKDSDLDFDTDVQIPDYVEVEADVTEFALDMTLTVAASVSSLNFDDTLDFSDLDEKIGTLSDSSTQLKDGMEELTDGVSTLKDSLGEFADGILTLQNGVKDYTDGVERLGDGIGDLKDGAEALDSGADTLVTGIYSLDDGAGTLLEGLYSLNNGAETLLDGIYSADNGAAALKAGIDSAAEGVQQLADKLNRDVKSGAQQLADGSARVAEGAQQLDAGVNGENGAKNGAAQLSAGASALKAGFEGEQGAVSGAAQVAGGVAVLAEQTKETLQQISTMKSTLLVSEVSVVQGVYQSAGQSEVAANINPSNVSQYAEGIEQIKIQVETRISQCVAAMLSQGVNTDSANAELQQGMDSLVKIGQAQGAVQSIQMVLSQLESSDASMSAEQVAALETQVDTLVAGANALSAGVQQLYQGSAQLAEGAQGLEAGLEILGEGASSLAVGSSTLANGAGSLLDGTIQLGEGANTLMAGMEQLISGSSDLKNGTSQLAVGAESLKDGASQLKNGGESLKSGTSQLKDGGQNLKDGTSQLKGGAAQLNDGVNELEANSGRLNDGASDLKDGTDQIADGVDQLNDGAKTLFDGMLQFDEAGIQTIVDAYNGDVKALTERVKAVLKAGADYDNFTGKESGMKSSVKFILKTAAVK